MGAGRQIPGSIEAVAGIPEKSVVRGGMLSQECIERAFEQMGLGSEENRNRYLKFGAVSATPDPEDEQPFIRISDATHPESSKEKSDAEHLHC